MHDSDVRAGLSAVGGKACDASVVECVGVIVDA